MKKAFLLATILLVSVASTACINNFAVQELNNKAKTYLDSGDFDNAISRLKSSIDLDSTIFETHYNLGIAYIQAEKYPEAEETFENAIKLRPEFADSYYSLGVAQENFAKGIINAEITADGKPVEKKEIKPISEATSDKKADITALEKEKVLKLLEASIHNYKTYLDKGDDIKDKEDVESKIEYLQKQADKYSNPENTIE